MWRSVYWHARQSRARRPISGAPRTSYSDWSARALGSYFARDRTPSGLRTDLGRYAQRLLQGTLRRHTLRGLLPPHSRHVATFWIARGCPISRLSDCGKTSRALWNGWRSRLGKPCPGGSQTQIVTESGDAHSFLGPPGYINGFSGHGIRCTREDGCFSLGSTFQDELRGSA